jgi:EAL domain-containing protein (putative c-di-GMP-specific phosphodiesterase class I)
VFGLLVCYGHAPKPDLDDSSEGYLHLMARVLAEHIELDADTGGDLRQQLDRIEGLIAPGGLAMVFQPICDLSTGEVVGAEALARFAAEPNHPPNVVFEDAWTAGRGVDLELAAVRAALTHLPELPPSVFLAVNLSPETILADELPELVVDVGSRIVLEVPERATVGSPFDVGATMESLRRAGVRLAADDAGAGFESLSQILELRPELIKFDVSLTREVDTDPVRRGLASSLVGYASQSEAQIVAEGIQTESELHTLLELGFGLGQGHLLGVPGPLPLPERRA